MYLFDHLKMTREPTLLLGMDVLGSFDVLVIDYRMREMQIKTRDRVLRTDAQPRIRSATPWTTLCCVYRRRRVGASTLRAPQPREADS